MTRLPRYFNVIQMQPKSHLLDSRFVHTTHNSLVPLHVCFVWFTWRCHSIRTDTTTCVDVTLTCRHPVAQKTIIAELFVEDFVWQTYFHSFTQVKNSLEANLPLYRYIVWLFMCLDYTTKHVRRRQPSSWNEWRIILQFEQTTTE